MKTTIINSVITIIFLLTTVACAPRGESKSVEEISKIAAKRFSSAFDKAKGSLGDSERSEVELIRGSLSVLTSEINGETFISESAKVAGALDRLLPKSGYTNRASLSDLQKQHHSIASGRVPEGDLAAAGKTLAMRTYHILASELESTRFKVEGLGA